jgi:hypothetical protein
LGDDVPKHNGQHQTSSFFIDLVDTCKEKTNTKSKQRNIKMTYKKKKKTKNFKKLQKMIEFVFM